MPRDRELRARETHRGVSPSFPEAVTAEDAPGCGVDTAGRLRDVLPTQVCSTGSLQLRNACGAALGYGDRCEFAGHIVVMWMITQPLRP